MTDKNINIDELIQNLSKVMPSHKIEKEINLFDIGIRGMYENPFTEILAYFLSKNNNQYDRWDNFVLYFLEELLEADNSCIDSLCDNRSVETQIHTNQGNYIDMILYYDKYAVIFENKIHAKLNNPLPDYEDYAKKQFDTQAIMYFVFSFDKIDFQGKWKNKQIGEIFKNVYEKINNDNKNKLFDKWDYFLADFLQHYIQEAQAMDIDDFEKCAMNFTTLLDANSVYRQFLDEIRKKIEKDNTFDKTKITSWNEADTAIHIKPLPSSGSFVLFILLRSGKYSVSVYYEPKTNETDTELEKKVGGGYTPSKEGKKEIWRFFYLSNSLANIEDALSETKKQITIMKNVYGVQS